MNPKWDRVFGEIGLAYLWKSSLRLERSDLYITKQCRQSSGEYPKYAILAIVLHNHSTARVSYLSPSMPLNNPPKPIFQPVAKMPTHTTTPFTPSSVPRPNHPLPLLTGCTFSYSLCNLCCSSNSITLSLFIRCLSASRITPSCID